MSLALLRIWRAPALQALVLQGAALAPMLAIVWLLARAGVPLTVPGAAALQGLLAAAFSRWRGLAPWWLPIQFLFPLALYGAPALGLPPWLFLAGFVLFLAIFWSTFRTQVPYYPSARHVRGQVAALLPQGRPVAMADVGSGLGGLVLELARRRPESRFDGIELAPLPWLASWLRARAGGSGARFIRADYEQCDFGAYDLVFAYLSPAAMPALWRKAAREMRPGAQLVSYEFNIDTKAPDITIACGEGRPNIYVWHF